MKKCRICQQEKPESDYYSEHHMRDGLMSKCKTCHNIARAERRRQNDKRFYDNNREKILKQKKAYGEENRECIRAKQAEYREQHREKAAATTRQWREENPERLREWYAANPDKVAVYNRRRYALRKGAFVEDVSLDALIQRDEGRCGVCGLPVMGPMSLDHIHPLSRGGTHEPANCQLAHPACNSRKGAKINFTPDRAAA